MSEHLSRCFMGTPEEIAAHHQLAADAKAMGREEVLSFLRDAANETLADVLGTGACFGDPGGPFDNSKEPTIEAIVAHRLLRRLAAVQS